MSDVVSRQHESSLFRRMRYTPVRDALRGHITGRLDIEARLERSPLPVPAKDLIRRVLRATRLWRLERADVADELIAHFADGLRDGETLEAFVNSFGDERRAAKLIRRAKRRNRPLAWHAMVFLRRLLLALVACYVLLAAYYLMGRPSPSVDYVGLLNERVAAIPAGQRAWPVYRDAIFAAGLEPHAEPGRNDSAALLQMWHEKLTVPQLDQWLDRNQKALGLARKAAAMPALGIKVVAAGQDDDPAVFPTDMPRGAIVAGANDTRGPLAGASEAHLVALWRLGDALNADAYHATDQGDPDRALNDIAAANAMAAQLREQDVLSTTEVVTLTLREDALAAAHHALSHAPAGRGLTPTHLQRLAHLFAGPDRAVDLVNLEAARAYARDLLQRVYTDDGNGDGRVTGRGIEILSASDPGAFAPQRVRKWSFLFKHPEEAMHSFRSAFGPLLPMLVASRREAVDANEQVMALAEANFAKPIRDADWGAYLRLYTELKETPANRFKFAAVVVPAADSMHVAAERLLGERDGLIVGAALESYHLAHGRYPDTLGALAPDLLPKVPVDRITGGSLHYRLVDGKPLVYSVGDDRDDDGGQPPVDLAGRPAHYLAARWHQTYGPAADGDWLLFPQPARTTTEFTTPGE